MYMFHFWTLYTNVTYVISIYLQVEKVSDPNSKNAKYGVYFYGTGET